MKVSACIAPAVLLDRLVSIGETLSHYIDTLGLVALGSSGAERERLDAFSDLDFYVVVADDAKERYLNNLDWIEQSGPLVYCFRNTIDGYKLLYADGVFCEFAIFTLAELAEAPAVAARIVWARAGATLPLRVPQAVTPELETSWLLGEALTNLYVGLGRFQRGEQLSATRFIQQYAVDHVLELVAKHGPVGAVTEDPFARERRIEQRYPDLAPYLPQFIQGYTRNPESALAILTFLEASWDVSVPFAATIRARAIRR